MTGSLVVISIDKSRLPEHTQEQYEEWVAFCVGERGGIDIDNPLSEHELSAVVREI